MGSQSDRSISIGAMGKLFGVQLGGSVKLAPPEICYPKLVEVPPEQKIGTVDGRSEEPQDFLFHADETQPTSPVFKNSPIENFTQVYSPPVNQKKEQDIMQLPSNTVPHMSIVDGKIFLGGDPRDPRNWTEAKRAESNEYYPESTKYYTGGTF